MEKKSYIRWGIEFLSITAITIILSKANWSDYWILVPIALILGLNVYESRAAVTEKHLRVKMQLDLLIKLVPFEDVLNVRCTYMVHIWRKRFLQTCDYIPDGGGGDRRFPERKGITGKSFDEKRPLADNFESDDDFRKKMVLRYNYTTEELKLRKADRKSYFCYPILDENHRVLGVIYFDSSHPNTFTLDSTIPRMKMIMRACDAIRDNLL
jgi:hypothetical protein